MRKEKVHPLTLRHVRVNNLKDLSLSLPGGAMIVFSGVSGSGKSSMAFDTIYAEGQNAYVDSLSHHPKLPILPRPEVESVEGVSPTIAIEQKSISHNPRSTVATMTQIHDFLRLLYARVGVPHCPITGQPVQPRSLEQILAAMQALPKGSRWKLVAPVIKGMRGDLVAPVRDLVRQGFLRGRLDGEWIDLEELPTVQKTTAHSLDVLVDEVAIEEGPRLIEAVTQTLEIGHGTFEAVHGEESHFFSMHAFSQRAAVFYPALEPHDFSFNHPAGMCLRCMGLGAMQDFDPNLFLRSELSLKEGACQLLPLLYEDVEARLSSLQRRLKVSVTTPWRELPPKAQEEVLFGRGRYWKGVVMKAREALHERALSKRDAQPFLNTVVCSACRGGRLKPYPLACRFLGKQINELLQLSLRNVKEFFDQVQLPAESFVVAEPLLQQIRQRLAFLLDVGLEYLTLDRPAPTLSGGESQRVRLACQIGSGLVGATYVLDEPSIGLHPSDNHRLLKSLRTLTAIGNRVIVVEHDEETILSADQVVDFGPGAGVEGGEILFQGNAKALLKCKRSLTADYLSGRRRVWEKPPRNLSGQWLSLKGATLHNLRGEELRLPLAAFVVITGPSGSGKSSLISQTLYPVLANALQGAELPHGPFEKLEGLEQLEKVIAIDQTPLGRMSRSNPATYTRLFDEIRDLYAQLPESVAKGYEKGRFSFNVKSGACARCAGIGEIRIELDASEEGWLQCPVCVGRRFDAETLMIAYKGKSIADVLDMTVREAAEFFQAHPTIIRILHTLMQAGLGYMRLGQSSVHLSGGEAQRVKLAKELARPNRRPCLYLLDEPTTGLHFHDIARLLDTLHTLVDRGHTVVVIEHNLDLIRTADWVIDLGPQGGDRGGKIVFQGGAADLAKSKTLTGKALSSTFKPYISKPEEEIVLDQIEIENASQNNLKNLSLNLPREAITVITGPSGSGKSSLAFETLFAEGQRRYSEALSPYMRQFIDKLPAAKVDRISGLSPAIAIEQRSRSNNPRSTVGTLTQIVDDLRVIFSQVGQAHCPKSGEPIFWMGNEQIAERLLKMPSETILLLLVPIREELSLREYQKRGFLRVYVKGILLEIEEALENLPSGPLFLVIDRFPTPQRIDRRLLESIELTQAIGKGVVTVAVQGQTSFGEFALGFTGPDGTRYPPLNPHALSFNHPSGVCQRCQGHDDNCSECHGTRLNAFARSVRWQGLSIDQFCQLPLQEALQVIQKAPAYHVLVQDRIDRTKHRLLFACQVGLTYLELARTAGTLSAGEVQRIRLSRQLGSGLTGVLYILDEPSIGLHPHEAHLLNRSLQELKKLGNTLVIVEHDPMIIEKADHLVEMGPGSGERGGELIFQGTVEEAKRASKSLTGKELNRLCPIRPQNRTFSDFIEVRKASVNNLQELSVDLPLNAFTCLTGRSGAGKSTLLEQVLQKGIELAKGRNTIKTKNYSLNNLVSIQQVISVDQDPLGASVRSDVATYLDLLPTVREFFCQLPAAKALGLWPMHFSYNHPAGMCTQCQGIGFLRIDMQFLPSIEVNCPACKGLRLKPQTLQITYRGYHLGQVLKMNVRQFSDFFNHLSRLQRPLEKLFEVGLDYLTVGQSLTTLSGGEAQRLKLCQELAVRNKGQTLYLFDEPTTGLHRLEVEKLIDILRALTQAGHTVIAIEHNLDMIRAADYVVDLGPGAGADGGRLLFAGSPERLKECRQSITGRYL